MLLEWWDCAGELQGFLDVLGDGTFLEIQLTSAGRKHCCLLELNWLWGCEIFVGELVSITIQLSTQGKLVIGCVVILVAFDP